MPVRSSRVLALASLLALAHPATVRAQQSPTFTVRWFTGEENPTRAIVSFDHDDDDEDSVPDRDSATASVARAAEWNDDLALVEVRPRSANSAGSLCVRAVTGGDGVRVIAGAPGTGCAGPDGTAVGLEGGRYRVLVQGVRPSRAADEVRLRFELDGSSHEVGVTVVSAALLQGDNSLVRAHRDAAVVSHRITNDITLPRVAEWDSRTEDLDTLRGEVWDPANRVGAVHFVSIGKPVGGSTTPIVHGAQRNMLAEAPMGGLPMRTRFVRLVSDDVDERAPGVQGQTLRTVLRDTVRLRYRRDGAAGEAGTDVRVGRPGDEDHPYAALRGRFHLVVLRDRPGGRPVFGDDEAGATRIAREQVAISNEAYAQCGITFGPVSEQAVTFADPPPAALIAVGDDDGLRALGGSDVRLRVGGRVLPAVTVRAGWTPLETATAIADALRGAGFVPRVSLNRRTDYGAEPSADVLVRDRAGRLVAVSSSRGNDRVSSDLRQRVSIGRVDLGDGLEEFNNLNSAAGTLEERTLLKSLADDDPGTVDVLFVNRFTNGTRIGEAFVEGDGAALVNHVILDRGGLFAQRDAWTLAHEAGHVLLNQPWHPDNMGPDRPWLLMDSDASLGAVNGPKRLEVDECRRIRFESGPSAQPALLVPFEPRGNAPSARLGTALEDAAWYPRPAVVPREERAGQGANVAVPAVRAEEAGFRVEAL